MYYKVPYVIEQSEMGDGTIEQSIVPQIPVNVSYVGAMVENTYIIKTSRALQFEEVLENIVPDTLRQSKIKGV